MRLRHFSTGVIFFLSMGILLSAGCVQKASLSSSGDPSLLTLDRIYNSREFRGESFGPARWLKNGSGYTTLEKSEALKEGKDIVRYDPASGKREVLVSAKKLIPREGKTPLEISGYSWSEDGTRLLIFTNTKRVWRRNTRGDYWVFNLKTNALKKLGGQAAASTLMFAKLSPDGTRAAYVIKNNIYVEELDSGRITQLTGDGSESIINGTSDWVYEEEFGVRDGFRWSPDGKHIAFWQFDTSKVPEFHMINNTDSLYPKIITFKHPKVGQTNSACRVGVVSVEGGDTLWFDPPGDSRNHYIARMDWAAGSDEIAFQRLNRLQNTNRLWLGDIHTGNARVVFTDQDKAWVEVVNDLFWLKGGQFFTWVSERDGWSHVYLVSRDGRNVQCLTPGRYDVISVQRIDEEGGRIYFTASPDNPTQRYLFSVPLDGSGALTRITPQKASGSHSYQISEDGRWAFHTSSSFGQPPVTELVKLPSHESVRILMENAALRKKVKVLKKKPVEFFKVDIGGGIQLDAWSMKPPDFDPAKKYPVLFYVYGEPAGSTVQDRWGGSGYLWHLMLTQQGYIVMSVDNRGTRAPRGRAWRKSIYRQIGILASQDQAAAVRAILKTRPYVDPKRIGIWGWSGGGSMSLNMIFRCPELYSTAMAIAFVADQHFYDSIYQERYMGLPDDNKKGYKEGSPVTYAHQLKGNLLIVHGTGDDNVHYQNFEVLVNELIKQNKQFTMMSYPNRSHGIYEGKNTTLHLRTLLTSYLKEHMPPGPLD